MAKIVILKNTGEEFKSFNVSASTFKNSPHTLLGVGATLQEILKALDEVLDIEGSIESNPGDIRR